MAPGSLGLSGCPAGPTIRGMRFPVFVMLLAACWTIGCSDDSKDKSNGPADPPGASQPATTSPCPASAASQLTHWAPVVRTRSAMARWLAEDWSGAARRVGGVLADGFADALASPAIRLARGDAYLAEGDFLAACRCFQQAAELDEHNLDALRGLSIALVASQQFEQAVPVYQRILAEDDRDKPIRFNLAVAYQRLANWERAEYTYKQILRDEPANARAWYNLATTFQVQAKLAEAAEAWRKTVQLAPQLAGAHASLGEVLMDQDDPAEAGEAFSQAAKLEPAVVSHWINLAVASREAGQLGRAVAGYLRALSLSPQDAGLWRELGSTRLEIYRLTQDVKMLAEAVAAWQKSLQLQPNQPDVAQWVRTYTPLVTSQPASSNAN